MADLNPRVKVTRSKHGKRDRSERFWRVEQETSPGVKRMFIYKSFRFAIYNAHRLANYQSISTYGLRGFQIEGLT